MSEDTDTTNQVDDDGATELDTEGTNGVETEVQETEPQFDDDGNPIEDQAEDEEEIDLGDIKLTLAKSQAEALRLSTMRMDDYTRKTQELAEQRKAIEAERQAVSQASTEELNARAHLIAITNQVSQLDALAQQNGGWAQWVRNDPFGAQEAKTSRDLLIEAGQKTNNYSEHLKQQRTLQEQQATAKLEEQGREAIAKAIPGWNAEKATKLMTDAKAHFGLTSDDLDGITDPRVVIVLNDAIAWKNHLAKTKKIQAVQKQQGVVPAAKVGGTTARSVTADTKDFAAFEKLVAKNL